MKSVKDIMTSEPACCEPNASLLECAQMMCENDCGEIPVVASQQDRHIVGVITDRDITCRAVVKGENPRDAKVKDFMTKDFVTVTETTTIDEFVNLLKQRQIRRLPVVDDEGRIVGIVSQADLFRKENLTKAADVLRSISEPVHA